MKQGDAVKIEKNAATVTGAAEFGVEIWAADNRRLRGKRY